MISFERDHFATAADPEPTWRDRRVCKACPREGGDRVRKSCRTRRRPARFFARGMLAENSTACAKSPMTPVSSRSTSHGDFAHPTTLAVHKLMTRLGQSGRHTAIGRVR
jgi:hypothetical protein